MDGSGFEGGDNLPALVQAKILAGLTSHVGNQKKSAVQAHLVKETERRDLGDPARKDVSGAGAGFLILRSNRNVLRTDTADHLLPRSLRSQRLHFPPGHGDNEHSVPVVRSEERRVGKE